MTIAGDETGDVVLDKVQLQVCEEMAETLVGPAAGVGEEADEWVEYDETGVNAVDSLKEAGEILRDGKRTRASGVRRRCRFLNDGEHFDAGEVSS
jgi:hypothetical protein